MAEWTRVASSLQCGSTGSAEARATPHLALSACGAGPATVSRGNAAAQSAKPPRRTETCPGTERDEMQEGKERGHGVRHLFGAAGGHRTKAMRCKDCGQGCSISLVRLCEAANDPRHRQAPNQRDASWSGTGERHLFDAEAYRGVAEVFERPEQPALFAPGREGGGKVEGEAVGGQGRGGGRSRERWWEVKGEAVR